MYCFLLILLLSISSYSFCALPDISQFDDNKCWPSISSEYQLKNPTQPSNTMMGALFQNKESKFLLVGYKPKKGNSKGRIFEYGTLSLISYDKNAKYSVVLSEYKTNFNLSYFELNDGYCRSKLFTKNILNANKVSTAPDFSSIVWGPSKKV